MAEQTLSELVVNLVNWIESLHEKNLKYEAQLESLSSELEKARSCKEELEARLSAYQEGEINKSANTNAVTVNNTANHHQIISPTTHPQTHPYPQHQQAVYQSIQSQSQPQQPQTIYQSVANQPTFAPQPSPYMWTSYDSNVHYPLH